MTKDEAIKKANEDLIGVYNRFPVVFSSGEGMYLFDNEGKRYLDFASGIGVNAFGYGDKEIVSEISSQLEKLVHVSNLYYTEPLIKAAAAVKEISGLDRVFFTNSGAEAVEGALKTAKRYYFNRTGKNDARIIAMNSSFHGRTMGSLSVTGTDSYRSPFYPLVDGVSFADFNDLSSVEKLIDKRTCAIIMETLQGEGGIHPATEEFLKGVRRLCDENNILLILDEIQCGMCRTGEFYTFQKYGVMPDILTTAKAIGLGLPAGAFLVTERVAENSLKPGDHGSTYGGNPLSTFAISLSIRLMKERKVREHVKELTPYFEEVLEEITKGSSIVKEHRGDGFIQGLLIDPSVKAGDIVSKALQEGLVLLTAEGNVVRMLPPLIAEKEDFDRMKEILSKLL
ncbi:MAG: acetylornithine/succinylornithine family transaminase [Lachnospiraceae bacterium]|nr:acetylornithine/succinylornithine family transaminase [Lachnospiraceae bacterium]